VGGLLGRRENRGEKENPLRRTRQEATTTILVAGREKASVSRRMVPLSCLKEERGGLSYGAQTRKKMRQESGEGGDLREMDAATLNMGGGSLGGAVLDQFMEDRPTKVFLGPQNGEGYKGKERQERCFKGRVCVG